MTGIARGAGAPAWLACRRNSLRARLARAPHPPEGVGLWPLRFVGGSLAGPCARTATTARHDGAPAPRAIPVITQRHASQSRPARAEPKPAAYPSALSRSALVVSALLLWPCSMFSALCSRVLSAQLSRDVAAGGGPGVCEGLRDPFPAPVTARPPLDGAQPRRIRIGPPPRGSRRPSHTPGPPPAAPQRQSWDDAIRAPSDSERNFAQAISGSTCRIDRANVAKPQSVPAMTRSRPTTSA
jgi:hypothetical protein